MTCIAWDGRTLAADKRMSFGGHIYTITKIQRVGDCLVGASGTANRVGPFLEWLRTGGDAAHYPANPDDADASRFVVIHRDGRIERYESTGYPLLIEDRYYAAGTGRDYARAAMHLGCDAREAVALACEFDENCGNGIDTLTFDSMELHAVA